MILSGINSDSTGRNSNELCLKCPKKKERNQKKKEEEEVDTKRGQYVHWKRLPVIGVSLKEKKI